MYCSAFACFRNPNYFERANEFVVDRFINADKFPQILAEPNPERFRRPPPPVLDERQRQLVGY